ncbi:MAG: ATP-binding protein [Lachnospira sp.]
MEYIKRIVDDELNKRQEAFNAINIIGPKGCGKTRTAKERCNTIIEFQDEEKRDGLLAVAETSPKLFFKNEKPILFDEWQDAIKIWGAIRKDCDDNPENVGNYYLTGSSSKKIKTPHTGTGRITEITMFPMTLWETGESNGRISLSKIVEDETYEFDGALSDLSLEELFFIVCRGGWPRCMALKSKAAQLEIAKDYYRQIYQTDISAIDGVKRNAEWARALMWSYARNMATKAKKINIFADVKATQNVTDMTLDSYVEKLQELFVIRDIDAWTPQIRSKTAIRSGKKHIFVDPSIGIAALGLNPDYFNNDLDLFGHVFENLVLRDLIVFAGAHNAHILHYTDDTGLEADAVYQMEDGRYALIEIKTGVNKIPDAEKSLLKFSEVIRKHNEEALKDSEHPRAVYREPSALIVICATAPVGYTTDNGVKIVPVGCLKD